MNKNEVSNFLTHILIMGMFSLYYVKTSCTVELDIKYDAYINTSAHVVFN